ncbi:MAG: BON domain-containing protein [Bacteriovoracaceae bacterium]
MTDQKNHIFHTDQGKWDRRDFENSEFDELVNSNEERESLQGRLSTEFLEDVEIDQSENYFDSGHIHNDEELEMILNKLFQTFNHHNKITFKVDHSNVTLLGEVNSVHNKEMAEKMVKLIHGIGVIKNLLVLK